MPSLYTPSGTWISCECNPPPEKPNAWPFSLSTPLTYPEYSSLIEFPDSDTVPENGVEDAIGMLLVMTFTNPPIVLGPYRMLAGPRTTSICETLIASIGVA